MDKPFVGCAGWSIPKTWAEEFPDEGSHLERYSTRFNGVEINSSFYRPHQKKTYAKWAAAVPDSFRFAVKVPKSITHEQRLVGGGDLLARFLDEVNGLGDKLGPLLVQLPPSLRFEPGTSIAFFSLLRQSFQGQVVCEPRHASWFTSEVSDSMNDFQVGRVLADPPPVPNAPLRGGWNGIAYYRLHGSPVIYRSEYTPEFLNRITQQIREQEVKTTWCIFDNTAEGAATGDALELSHWLSA